MNARLRALALIIDRTMGDDIHLAWHANGYYQLKKTDHCPLMAGIKLYLDHKLIGEISKLSLSNSRTIVTHVKNFYWQEILNWIIDNDTQLTGLQ